MADHVAVSRTSWFDKVKTFEPALLRAIITALVGVAALVGLDLTESGDKIVEGWTYLFALIPLIQGWWTRTSVSPASTVVAQVEKDSGAFIAGPAAPVVDGTRVAVDPIGGRGNDYLVG
jgi:hypothetical protein